MGRKLLTLWIMWASLILLQHFNGQCCLGCLETERAALLQLKHSVQHLKDTADPAGFASWVDDGKSDCCGWERVECNLTTGRVIGLFLNFTRGESIAGDAICRSNYNWLLNFTMFLPLQQLQHLDLSYNCISGWLENEGLERLSKLKNLEQLDLGYNLFDSGILSSLASLTSLKTLSLEGNDLNTSNVPSHGLEILSGLKKLETLELGWSYFSNSMLPSLGTLTSLKKLSLRGNYLNGPFPAGLCKLKDLQELDLNTNNFEGVLPACLVNLTSLRILDLSNNQFRGNLSSSPINGLTSLEIISLGYNSFDPTLPLISLSNHSKLVELYLDNFTHLAVETKYTHRFPIKFQLKILTLSYCNFNKRPVNVALGFLNNQHDLQILRVSYTNLTGEFPTWLIENNTMLDVLDFRINSLTGFFRLPTYPHTSLRGMDISSNQIHGDLQASFGEILPNLWYLNLSSNSFGDKIPSTIGEMRHLHHLDLSSNNFSGEIPASLATGCTMLNILKLSNNNLYGQIFPDHEEFNLSQLVSLRLSNNHFVGSIPVGISRCTNLQVFNVGKNQLSGTVPAWIGNLTGLRTIVMKENLLEGHIAHEICGLVNVEFMDLSENYLSGLIPPCQNLSSLQFIHLQRNRFRGPIPNAFLQSKPLVTMNLGYNRFSGSIPNWVGDQLVNLKVLILKANDLRGSIPHQLCQLNQIGIMDLSYNGLSGSIPPCFRNITFWKLGAIRYTFEPKALFQLGIPSSFPHQNLLNGGKPYVVHSEAAEQEEVEFITKNTSNSYKGSVLSLMSGLDLSCNNLTGEIPSEIGDLSQIHALNLSHNQLSGEIPSDLSELKQLESLDLSHNKLRGEIPSNLIELNFLAVFSVAYNNLSGRTPDEKGQFGTFKETSYEGNPFLCGPPLKKNNYCNTFGDGNPKLVSISDQFVDRYGISFVTFSASFATSYVMCLIGFVAVLYINPYWRWKWFDFIDACMDEIHVWISFFKHLFCQ